MSPHLLQVHAHQNLESYNIFETRIQSGNRKTPFDVTRNHSLSLFSISSSLLHMPVFHIQVEVIPHSITNLLLDPSHYMLV